MPEATFVVTGASGFLGSQVMARLAADGLPSIALVRRSTVTAVAGVQVATVVDYRDARPPSPDAVLIHCAEPRDAAAAEADEGNHIGQVTGALRALLQSPWRQVVFISSAVVYGDGVPLPRQPDEQPSPGGAYARGKVACERLALAANATVVRLANLYGPRMARHSVLGDILAQIPGDGPLAVRDTAPVRDFLWIGDAAAAVVALARRGVSGIYNVGSGEGVSIGTLAATALRLAGESDRRVVATAPESRRSVLVLDISRTLTAAPWRPAIPLETGLRMLLRKAA